MLILSLYSAMNTADRGDPVQRRHGGGICVDDTQGDLVEIRHGESVCLDLFRDLMSGSVGVTHRLRFFLGGGESGEARTTGAESGDEGMV